MADPLSRPLVDEERRDIVGALRSAPMGRVTVDSLVQELAGRQNDGDSIRIRLYHHHLPKLEDMGLLEYDWRSGDVVLAVEKSELPPVLGPPEDREKAVWAPTE